MLLAWGITETIRYSYFTIKIMYDGVGRTLTWLRYNAFFVLYRIGIMSEIWLIVLATEPAKQLDPRYEYGIWAVLAIYVPGESFSSH